MSTLLLAAENPIVFAAVIIAQITVVVGLAAAAERLLFRRSATSRHAVWLAALLAVLASPLIAWGLPKTGWSPIELPSRPPENPALAATIGDVSTREQDASAPYELDAAGKRKDLAVSDQSPLETPPISRQSSDFAAGTLSESSIPSPRWTEWLRIGCNAASVIWVAGVCLLIARLVHGWWTLEHLRRDAALFGSEHGDLLSRVRDRVGLLPHVFVTPRACKPFAVGVIRPRIIVPRDLAISLSASELEDLLVHEAAHIVRRDSVVLVLQRIAEAVYWPHPLVHELGRRLFRAREEVCDNYVLRTGDRQRYAAMLFDVSTRNSGASLPHLATALDSFRWRLEHRIAGLLDDRRRFDTRTPRGVLSMAAIVFMIAIASFLPGTPAPTHAESVALRGEEGRSAARESRLALNDDPQVATSHPRVESEGLLLGTQAFRYGGHGNLAFAGDSKTIVSIQDGRKLLFWNARTGELIREIAGLWSETIRVSPDGQHVATISSRINDDREHSEFSAWSIASGERTSFFEWNDDERCECFDYTPDGTAVVIGDTNGNLAIRNLATGEEMLKYRIANPGREIRDVAISPDGRTIAVAADTDGLFVWSWLGGDEPQAVLKLKSNISALAFSPDSRLLAVGFASREDLRIVDVSTREIVRSFSLSNSQEPNIGEMCFSPDGKKLYASHPVYGAATNVGSVRVWDVPSGTLVDTLEFEGVTPRWLSLSPDGQLIVSASWSGPRCVVWDVATGQPIEAKSDGHNAPVTDIRFVADGSRIATASDDGTVRFWDAASGRQTMHLRHENWVRGLDLSHDGRLVASSSFDETVRVWDAANGAELRRFTGAKHGGCRAVAFSAENGLLASACDDASLRVWNLQSGELVAEHTLRADDRPFADSSKFGESTPTQQALRFLDAGTRLYVSSSPTSYVYDVMTGNELHRFQDTPDFGMNAAIDPTGALLICSVPGGPRISRKMADGRVRDLAHPDTILKLVSTNDGSASWTQTISDAQSAGPMTISDDGRLAAVAIRSREELRVYDMRSGRVLATLPSTRHLWTLRFSPDGRRLACGDLLGLVHVQDLKDAGIGF